MKKYGKGILFILTVALLLACMAPASLAHSGRTDSQGGHNSPTGYHYHHGYGPHQHPGGYCPYTDVFPRGVKLSAEKTVLGMGEKAEITAAVSPSNACSKSVSWSSSDTSVVRVSSGRITAVGYGTATITATTFNDKTTSVRITVQEITADSITLTGIEGGAKTIYIGDSLKLGAVLTPAKVDRPEITWTSSNPAVASVEGGLITARSSGTATITAATTNGLTTQVELTVEEIVAQKIEIKAPEEITIGETVQLETVITPANTTYQDVRWQSSDPAVAEITDEGFLTARGVGQVTVRAVQKDVRAEITFDIRHIPVTEVAILSAGGFEGTLPQGETTRFTASIQPAGATYPAVTWTSSDPGIAAVDENGLVTAIGEGEVTLTASTRDGVTDTLTFRAGSKLNAAAVAGGAGGGGVALLGASYVLLKKKKKPSAQEAKRGVDKMTVTFLSLAVAVAGGAGFAGVNGSNADKYDRALFLSEAGRPCEAAALFQTLGSYQDSADRLNMLTEEYPVVKFQFAASGDMVTFGSYEQDNDPANGREPIQWLVLNKGETRMLAVSQKVLDVRPYIPDNTEEDSRGLYEWLYTDFFNTAFQGCNISPIRELRLLTRDECQDYISYEDRKAEYTPYAKSQHPTSGYAAGYMWWLDGYFRFNRDNVGPVVWEDGSCSNNSTEVEDRVGIRPALLISLVGGEETTFTIYSGMREGPIVTVDQNGDIISQNTDGPNGGSASTPARQ